MCAAALLASGRMGTIETPLLEMRAKTLVSLLAVPCTCRLPVKHWVSLCGKVAIHVRSEETQELLPMASDPRRVGGIEGSGRWPRVGGGGFASSILLSKV